MNKGETVCAIMQNPSVANEEVADKSVQFLEKLIFEKSYPLFKHVSRLIIVNQFAFIQTNNFVDTNGSIGKNNDVYIKKAIKNSKIILVAWGKTNAHYQRREDIKKIISFFRDKKVYQTKKHPSRGCYEDFIIKYSE